MTRRGGLPLDSAIQSVSCFSTTSSQLLHACTETEVIELLTNAGYWLDARAWRPYGDNESNFSIIGNQQARSDAALVEKVVNSVDARLLNECLIRGIDPEGSTAPKSIQ